MSYFFVEDRKGQTWTDYENWLVVHLHRVQEWNLSTIASVMRRSELAVKCQLEKLYGVHKDSLVFSNRTFILTNALIDEIRSLYLHESSNWQKEAFASAAHKVSALDIGVALHTMWFDEVSDFVTDKALKLRKHALISETAKLLPNLYIRIGEVIKGLSATDFISLAVETLPDEHWFLIEDYVKCIEKLAGTLSKTDRRRQTYLRDCYRQSIRKILSSDKGYKPEVLEWLILHKFF